MEDKKKAYIIHGWDGSPEEGWFPWLKKELEARGFLVLIPSMPDPDEPRIDKWVSALKNIVIPGSRTFLIGYSIGCQAIIRYLESLPPEAEIGGAVFVAGWMKSIDNLEDDESVRDVAREWLESPIDFAKVKSKLKKSVAIFSDNDPYVPLENKDDFAALGSKIVIEHNLFHFEESRGTKRLPSVLGAIIELS